jgi:hypothetical protein
LLVCRNVRSPTVREASVPAIAYAGSDTNGK